MESHQVIKNIKSLILISTSTHFNVYESQPVILPYVMENWKFLQRVIAVQKLFSKE